MRDPKYIIILHLSKILKKFIIITACLCKWFFIFYSRNFECIFKLHETRWIRSHFLSKKIIFLFHNFKLIILTIKKKWFTLKNTFRIFPTYLVYLSRSIFPFVWTIPSNHWIHICLDKSDGFFVVFTFIPQNIWI